MSWPLSQDYNEAIQSPASNFADPDLKRGEAVCNALGLPAPYSGNFADVYQVRCPDGSRWAVKCFTREALGLHDRYQEISAHLKQAKLPFMVDFSYLDRGIRVSGKWHPILKMQWVEGLTLNQFVERYLEKPAMLEALLQVWARTTRYLRAADVAHCDLQHGNILLVPGATPKSLALKLIDYDGMWVPALAGKPSGEIGHANYQHPQRLREGTYNLDVDRFPVLLIATAMRAVKARKSLWERYDNGDNMLFKESDLAAPGRSELFEELSSLPDAGLVMLAAHVRAALRGSLESAALLEEAMPETRPAAAAKGPPSGVATRKAVPVVAPVAAAPASEALAFEAAEAEAPQSIARKKRRRIKKSAGARLAAWFGGGLGHVQTRVWIGVCVALAAIAGEACFIAGLTNSRKADLPASRPSDFGVAQKDSGPLPPVGVPGANPVPAPMPADQAPPPVVQGPEPSPGALSFETGWDKPVDPDGDCKFTVDKTALTIEAPGKRHDYGFGMNAPRILRDVEGDFTAEVRVGGELRPVRPGTVLGANPFVQAGLLVMADDRACAALIRTTSANPTMLSHGVDMSVWPNLREQGGGHGDISDAPTYLRLRRVGNRFFGSFSQNDGKWTDIQGWDREVEMPARAKLGVYIITLSSAPFKARFDDFRLTKGGPSVNPPPLVAKPLVDDDWLRAVAAMSTDQQVRAVADELKKRNPGFDGKVTPTIVNGVVVGLEFLTDEVTDIAPVRALVGLRTLICHGTLYKGGGGALVDLSPLKGMPLTTLDCSWSKATDLSPLKGMPLTTLECGFSSIADLSPLAGMPLTYLNCTITKVSDLSPLKGMPLKTLHIQQTPVSDLSPLKGMPLTLLNCHATKVSDLSPLKGMPLTILHCAETLISDLSPLKSMKLTDLNCCDTPVSDLSPLKGMPLKSLWCSGTKVSDLSPLAGMPLEQLVCGATPVSDLSPLKGMPLSFLACAKTKVADLSLLKDMPLKDVDCDFKPERDTAILRSIPTLAYINGKSAKDFWNDVNAKQPEKKP